MSAYTCSAGLLALVLAVACSGGGGGGPTAPATATGVFGTPPVEGLSYASGTLAPTLTGPGGTFTYQVGQPVTFCLGGIHLPAVTGAAQITLFSLFGVNSFNDPPMVNLARLLQAVDADHAPDNGIAIAPAVRSAAAGVTLTDFASPSFDANVAPVVAAAGSTALPDPGPTAVQMQSGSIIGTWVVGGTFAATPGEEGFQFLSLWPDGTYLHGFSSIGGLPAGPDLQPGLERGTYTRNPGTETVRFTTLHDTNGNIGPSSPHGAAVTLHLADAGTLVVTGPGGSTTLKRVQTVAGNPACGTWFFFSPATGSYLSLVLLPTWEYMVLQDERQPAMGGTPGIEYGTYTFDPGTHAFSATPVVDSNGEWGFSHSNLATAEISGVTLHLGNSTLTLTRLEP